MPVIDLFEGLGEGVDDDGRSTVTEALDGEIGGLLGIVGCVPQTDDDAVVRKMRANALTDGPGLGEGEGGQGRDENDSIGLIGQGVEDFAGD